MFARKAQGAFQHGDNPVPLFALAEKLQALGGGAVAQRAPLREPTRAGHPDKPDLY